jgi:flagellar hook-basal body complex protein FliE
MIDKINYKPFPLTPSGDKVSIKTTDSRHYGDKAELESVDNVAESFASALKKSLEKVNDLQIHADELTQKMIYNPNSVDAHEVMIAAEKARMALTFTKTIADGVIKAYRDLTNLR